jgi:general secretion pathway protein J
VRRAQAAGFTLIEVMIALMIFGMIAAAGVAILAFSVRAQGASGAALDDIGAINRLSSILTADLAQAVDRPTRDQNGTQLPAFTGGSGQPVMLRLVRGGWSNLDAAPRAGEQKVEYRLTDGALQRVAYPMLDGAQSLPPAVLLNDVRQVALRYRTDGAWSDRWQGPPTNPLPQLVEMRLVRTDGREFRQLFLVGTGYRPTPADAVDVPR